MQKIFEGEFPNRGKMITNNNFLSRLIGKVIAELLLYVNLALEENSHADVFDYGVELSNLATIKLS